MKLSDLINARYGNIPLMHVGDLSVLNSLASDQSSAAAAKELAIYSARILVPSKTFDYNLIILAVPLALDCVRCDGEHCQLPTVASLPWITMYTRSYRNLEMLKGAIDLDWRAVAGSVEHKVGLLDDKLTRGLWVKELRGDTVRGKKNKYYFSQADPDYVVSIEARIADATHGSGLREQYEFDMLLNYNSYNLAVENVGVVA